MRLDNVATRILLVLFTSLAFSSKASAIYTVCGWYEFNGDPRIYTESTYSFSDAAQGNAMKTESILIQPFIDGIEFVYDMWPGGGSEMQYLQANLGETYTFSGNAEIGFFNGETFFHYYSGPFCNGSIQFDPPSNVNVTITPSTVNVGDNVSIVWSSQDAQECYYEGGSIGTSGSTSFAAQLSDAGLYVLECMNIWATVTDQEYLTVNDSGPDCPADPNGVDEMSYPLSFGNDPGDGYIGLFSTIDNPSITSQAYCTSTDWRLKVVEAEHSLKIDVNLSNMGNTQITNAIIDNASCSALETMKTSLADKASSVNATFGGWYDEGAVIAHEHVHRKRYQAIIDTLFESTVSDIEAISIPLSAASNPAEAYALLTGSNTSYSFIIFNLGSNAANEYLLLGHSNPSEFIVAQQNAVAPFISKIDQNLEGCS